MPLHIKTLARPVERGEEENVPGLQDV